jgi:hypothetical protein
MQYGVELLSAAFTRAAASPDAVRETGVSMKSRHFCAGTLVAIILIVASASASINYTPVNRVIPNDEAYGIDFNHDGVKDFWIGSFFGTAFCGLRSATEGSANISPVKSTSGVILNGVFAAALPAGVSVGFAQSFSNRQTQLLFFNTCGAGQLAGNWFNVSNHYLGLVFQIAGQTHFGWAELSITGSRFGLNQGLTTVVVGFAYETIAGKTIITGQTGVPNACAPPSTDQTIHICTPLAGSTVPTAVAISAQARWDSHTIYYMRVYIDNVHLYDKSQPPGGAINVTLSLSAGSHHLVIMAWDTLGNYILSGETFTTQ